MKKRGFRLNLVYESVSIKKKIVFINIKKSYNVFTIQIRLFYYFLKNKIVLLVYFSNLLLKKYHIVTKNLKYFYTLKGKSTSPFILNNKLNYLTEFFHNIKDLGCTKNLNYLSNSKYILSVIRSPFVYKKSMEQFFYETYAINYQTNVSMYNVFFHNYQYIYLKKILHRENFLKFFCKITFIFN